MTDEAYRPCAYCGSTECRAARLKKGIEDRNVQFPWTRSSLPAETHRPEFTLCEVRQWADVLARAEHRPEPSSQPQLYADPPILTAEVEGRPGMFYITGATLVKAKGGRTAPAAEMSAAEIANRILPVLRIDKARSVERLCRAAGIPVSEKVSDVLKVLRKRGIVASRGGGILWRRKEV